MKMIMCLALLLSASFVWGQSDQTAKPNQPSNNNDHGQITVRGCLSRQGGDYVLMKEDPANTYELQATDKIKLSSYLGQRVEISGTKSPSMSTSEDTNRPGGGNASPVTINVSSIKTISRECRER